MNVISKGVLNMHKYADDNCNNSTDVDYTYVDTHKQYPNRYILPVNCTDAYNIRYPIRITKLFQHKTLRFKKVYNASSQHKC